MALKLGVQEKKWKIYAAAALGVVVVGLLVKDFFGGDSATPTTPIAAVASPPARATTSRPSTASTASHEATKVAAPVNLDPTLHPELMAQAEALEYTGNGRNIFSLTSVPIDIPKPIAPARLNSNQVAQTGPPPPAPPPPIDLKFFGYSSRQGGVRRAFLLKGDDVFIASEGDVVDHRYKVVKIAPMSVEVEDIPYANTQNLPLMAN